MTVQLSAVSTSPPSFPSPGSLLRLHSVTWVIMKMLNSIGPSISPWCTPLVTGLQLELVPLITILQAWIFRQFLIDSYTHMRILLCCSSFFLFLSHSSIMLKRMLSHPVLTLMSLTFPEWGLIEQCLCLV